MQKPLPILAALLCCGGATASLSPVQAAPSNASSQRTGRAAIAAAYAA